MNDSNITMTAIRRRLPALRPFAFPKANADGFTLVELLVVIATVAMLATLLLPALAGTKPIPQAFQCQENLRQLTLAWQMYAEDNNDLLPPNDYPYTTSYVLQSATWQAQHKNWVVGTMNQPLDQADAFASIGKSYLLDPNTVLSPYQTNRAVYHCPADNFISPSTKRAHVRSYSMNSAVGTIFGSAAVNGGSDPRPVGSPVAGGWLGGSTYNPNQTTWLTYGKMSSFSRPGPANTFVIIDENPISINDGRMEVSAAATPGHTYLIDFPSGNHNAAAAIAFADGHVLVHQWLDARTYTPAIAEGAGGQVSTGPTPDDPDCFYLGSITSALR
jgi:prepilin-type N-terminal cleavage/methylation domain-containing protein/prepilin-type processing-associated H-X9-DG protein